jgi:hypothetical protein
MPVDRGAEVVHHPLAHLVGEPRLEDAEDPSEDRDPDQPEDEDRQQAVVVLGQRLVEDVSDEERRDDAEKRREADEGEHGTQAPAICLEEAEDPAQVRAPHGRVGGSLGWLVWAEARPHEPTLAARAGATARR